MADLASVPDEYDHDRISITDLIELGVTAAGFRSDDGELPIAEPQLDASREGVARTLGKEDISTVAEPAREEGAAVDIGTEPSAPCWPMCAAHDVQGTTARSEAPVIMHNAEALPVAGDTQAVGDIYFEDQDVQPTRDEPVDDLWYLEVPEVVDEEVAREFSRTGVSSDERAMQLALEFLRDQDLYSERHLDLLADIIRQRGWSSVQLQVRGLIQAGYGVAQIHRMFQLTDVWLHCVESDTLAPERWHGGKRLTWLEAAHLLDFLGHDAEFDQIADFLSSEQEVWHGLRRSSGHLATFKNYLFEYRLSHRTQVDDGIWQCNLDADDPRSFDGTRNQLYRTTWWDEPIDSGARSVRQMFGAICDPARIAEWLSPDAEEMF